MALGIFSMQLAHIFLPCFLASFIPSTTDHGGMDQSSPWRLQPLFLGSILYTLDAPQLHSLGHGGILPVPMVVDLKAMFGIHKR